MINNRIRELANDSRCLMAVVPANGGEWIAPIRQNTWKHFTSSDRMTWTDIVAAEQVADWTHDYTFQAKFMIPSGEFGSILFASNMSACIFSAYITQNSAFYMSTALLHPTSSSAAYYARGSVWTDIYDTEHTIKMVVAGTTIAFHIDGVQVAYNTYNLERTAKESLNLIDMTTTVGYLYECTITDDTVGELIWEAPHKELQTRYPQISNTPRNFYTEPATWHDEKVQIEKIGEDDCEFFIHYRIDAYIENDINQIFYHNSQNGSVNIGFNMSIGNNYSYVRLTDSLYFIIPINYVRQLGEHTIRIRRIGLIITVEFDNTVIATSTTGTVKTAVYSTAAPMSRFRGTIIDAYWKNLVTDETVWNYPIDAERVRLLTYNNTHADEGGLYYVNPSTSGYISTPLDMRRFSAFTLFAVVDIPADIGEFKVIDLIAQGNGVITNGGSGTQCVFDLFYLSENNRIYLRFYGTNDAIAYAPNLAGKRVKIAASITGNNVANIYINGAKVLTQTVNANRSLTADFGTVKLLNATAAALVPTAKLQMAFVFNGAFSDEEVLSCTRI